MTHSKEIHFPTELELEQSRRFRTYVNYLNATAGYLQQEYDDPSVLVDQIVTSKGFKSIQGGRLKDKVRWTPKFGQVAKIVFRS